MKITFEGSSILRKTKFFSVADKNVSVKGEEYICDCKDCSITRIPNDLPPRCRFVRALKVYLGK